MTAPDEDRSFRVPGAAATAEPRKRGRVAGKDYGNSYRKEVPPGTIPTADGKGILQPVLNRHEAVERAIVEGVPLRFGSLAEQRAQLIASLERRGFTIERQANVTRMQRALEQAWDCIRDETPEDCTREEARDDTLAKIREALGQ